LRNGEEITDDLGLLECLLEDIHRTEEEKGKKGLNDLFKKREKTEMREEDSPL